MDFAHIAQYSLYSEVVPYWSRGSVALETKPLKGEKKRSAAKLHLTSVAIQKLLIKVAVSFRTVI